MKPKTNIHPNNKHKSGYDLDALCEVHHQLSEYVFVNQYDVKTIDFGNPKAVKVLNTAFLFKYYGISFWEFPDSNLCPPIPGRVDYLHHIADLLASSNIEKSINVLDIGTGATCIYPLLGQSVYGWQFVGTDIDVVSLNNAQTIIDKNNLDHLIALRHQPNKNTILKGILKASDNFSVSICNPPFYTSEAEAIAANLRKLEGLKQDVNKPIRNFSGTQNELWYKGGEKAFIHNYLYESSLFKTHCVWYTSLVSNKELVRGIKVSLKKLGATEVKVIPMGQGNKVSRIIAWTFQ